MKTFDPKKNLQERVEVLKIQSKEKVQESFTRLPKHLIEAFLGIEQKEDQNKPKNFTKLDGSIREKLGKEFDQQDSGELEEARDTITAIKRQLDYVRKEESEAREYFRRKEEERKKQEEEEEQLREIQEQQRRQQAASAGGEPTTKQKRGSLHGAKKPKKTAENAPSFGKQ